MSISESGAQNCAKGRSPSSKILIFVEITNEWKYDESSFVQICLNLCQFSKLSGVQNIKNPLVHIVSFCEIQKASIVCGLEPYMFVTCFGTSVWFVSPHNSICSPDYCLPLHAMFLNELWEFHVSRTGTEYIYVHLYCFQSYFF